MISQLSQGQIGQKQVTDYVNDICPRQFVLETQKEGKEECDFRLMIGESEFLFEVYTPFQDETLFFEEIKNKNPKKDPGGAEFAHEWIPEYLAAIAIQKYFHQFKGKQKKFLVLNLNACGNLYHCNLNYVGGNVSDISKIFSTKVHPQGTYGLFHMQKIKICDDMQNTEILQINNLKEMSGCITFFKNKFIEMIVNPFSESDEHNEIAKLFKITKITLNKNDTCDPRAISVSNPLQKKIVSTYKKTSDENERFAP